MPRRLVVGLLAQADLDGIRGYIAASSPKAAERFVDLIEQRCQSLVDFPERGRLRDDLTPGLRLLPIDRTVVVAYRFEPETVEIVRVWYGGRKYQILTRV